MARILNAIFYDKEHVRSLLHRQVGENDMLHDSYLRFFDPGDSIVHLRDAMNDRGQIFYPQDWYDNQPFAQKADTPQERCLLMAPIEGSLCKTWEEQQTLLSNDEEVPTARIVVMGMVIHFLATGQRLFERCYVRTTDVGAEGTRVLVGRFDAVGLGVSSDWDGRRGDGLGVATLRKFS
jgi:hypothetical protein